jgi:hypothetical protein
LGSSGGRYQVSVASEGAGWCVSPAEIQRGFLKVDFPFPDGAGGTGFTLGIRVAGLVEVAVKSVTICVLRGMRVETRGFTASNHMAPTHSLSWTFP